jgi:hypothetical protein
MYDDYNKAIKVFEDKITKEATSAKGFFGSYVNEERKLRAKYAQERKEIDLKFNRDKTAMTQNI